MSDVSRAPARPLVYQPGLDGLRGLAVVAVLLYHQHGLVYHGLFRGGYIGVDIFFVLSGFLITWLLLEEREASGSIRLGRFWGRRVRRLVPALLAMLVLVAVLDRLVFGTTVQSFIRADVPWVLGYGQNWHFAISGGTISSPLSHTWSLAVEEQWYLVWPIVLPLLCIVSGNRARRLLGIVMGIAIAIAVATPLLLDSSQSGRVFFGTDFRAQELLVGGALAVWCALIANGATSIGVASPIPSPKSARLAFLLGYAAGTTSEGTTRVLVVGGEEAVSLKSTTFGAYQGDRLQGIALGVAGCGFTSTARRCANVTGDVPALTHAYRARWVVLLPSELDLSQLGHARPQSKFISRFDHSIENLPGRRVAVVIAACKADASSPRRAANDRLRFWARRRGVRVVPLGGPRCAQTAPAPTVQWPALVEALRK